MNHAFLLCLSPVPHRSPTQLLCTALRGVMEVGRVTGVDISTNMIQKARGKGCYDDLHVSELSAFFTDDFRSLDGAHHPRVTFTFPTPYLHTRRQGFLTTSLWRPTCLCTSVISGVSSTP